MIKYIYPLFLFFIFCSTLFAQVEQLVNEQLRANFGPNGATTPPVSSSFLEVQEGEDWVSLIFESGLLIAGTTTEGTTKLFSTQGMVEAGFRGIDAEIGAPWRVTREQVDAHRADFADNGVIDSPIPAIFAWPGRANPFFEEYNGYDLLGAETDNLAWFWDANAEGVYTPDRGDYPILGIRGCIAEPIVPSEMLFYPILLRDEEEVFFQIFLTAFRYDCFGEGTAANNTLFLHYQVINYSGLGLEECYVGYWVDGDLGCYTDDYLGTFPDRNALYFYNAQEADADCATLDDDRFNEVPAAVGLDLLRGPLDPSPPISEIPLSHVMPIQNGQLNPNAPPATTEPATAQEYYSYLSGRWRDGLPLLDQGIGYETGTPTELAFTGNPSEGTGWTEVGEGNVLGDRKAIFSTGPFTLQPGAVNEFTLSLTFSKVPELSHLEQVSNLRNRIDTIQQFFDSCFEQGGAGNCTPLLTSSQDLEAPTKYQLIIYPNPARGQVSIRLPEQRAGTLRVFSARGQELLQKRTFSEILTLDVQDWARGIYFLRWEDAQEVRTNKLLVD